MNHGRIQGEGGCIFKNVVKRSRKGGKYFQIRDPPLRANPCGRHEPPSSWAFSIYAVHTVQSNTRVPVNACDVQCT